MLKDYFLNAGDTLVIPPGVKVVIESMELAQYLPAAFDWDSLPPLAKNRCASRQEMLLAAGELGKALSLVGRALRRLAGAVLASPMRTQRPEIYS